MTSTTTRKNSPQFTDASSGADLWLLFQTRAGLDLAHYDRAVEDSIREQLFPASNQSLLAALKAANTAPTAVIVALFASLRPFTELWSDVLAFCAAAGARHGKENVRVRFDFGQANEISFSLEEFKEQIETLRTVTRPLTIETWPTDDLFKLTSCASQNVSGEIEDADVRAWLHEAEGGRWPVQRLAMPSLAGVPPEFQRAWRLWQALVDAASTTLHSPRPSRVAGRRGTLVIGDGAVTSADSMSGHAMPNDHLQCLAQDRWYVWCLRALSSLAEAISRGDGKTELEDLCQLVQAHPQTVRPVETIERDIEDLLALPAWKARHELYSLWVLTEMVNACGGTDAFNITVVDGVFDVPFSSTRIAVSRGRAPEAAIWAEVRSPLANPAGKTRKENVQPDYLIASGTQTRDSDVFLIVECKQYLRAVKRGFATALFDYARARPQAQVVLVNYGPCRADITKAVPPSCQSRTLAIGELRPGSVAAISEFRELVSKVVDTRCPHPPPPQVQQTSNTASTAAWADTDVRIVLTWSAVPEDLDLHLALPPGAPVHRVAYDTRRPMSDAPYAELDGDVRNGFGPETIRMSRALTGSYEVWVHRYTGNGTLAMSEAKVIVHIDGVARAEAKCPSDGTGDWWHVGTLTFPGACWKAAPRSITDERPVTLRE